MKVQIVSPVSSTVTMLGSQSVPRKSCYNLRPSEVLKLRLSPGSMSKVCQSSTPTPRKSSRIRRKTVHAIQQQQEENNDVEDPSVISFEKLDTEELQIISRPSTRTTKSPEVKPQDNIERRASNEKEVTMGRKSDCLLEENRRRTRERASFERPQSERRHSSKKPRLSLRKLKHAEASEELNMDTTFPTSTNNDDVSQSILDITMDIDNSPVNDSPAKINTSYTKSSSTCLLETPGIVPLSETPTLNEETVSPSSSDKSTSIEPRNLQDDFKATAPDSTTRVPRIELSNVQIFALADGMLTPLHISKKNAQLLYHSGIKGNQSSTSNSSVPFPIAPLPSSVNLQDRINEVENERDEEKEEVKEKEGGQSKTVMFIPSSNATINNKGGEKISKPRAFSKSIIKRNILATKTLNTTTTTTNSRSSTNKVIKKKVGWSIVETREPMNALKGYMKPTFSSRAKASKKDFLKPEPQSNNASLTTTPKKKPSVSTPRSSCKTKYYGRKTIVNSKK